MSHPVDRSFLNNWLPEKNEMKSLRKGKANRLELVRRVSPDQVEGSSDPRLIYHLYFFHDFHHLQLLVHRLYDNPPIQLPTLKPKFIFTSI
jgi:hypothetical protein